MGLATYDELKDSVQDWLNRSDTLPVADFIEMAEADMSRQLRTSDMLSRATATVNAQFTKLPTNFIGMRGIELQTDPVVSLKYLTPQAMDEYRHEDSSGQPIYYSIMAGTIELVPVPDTSTYTIEIMYYSKIPGLSANQTSNWVLDRHPDLYLMGALMNAAPYLIDDQRIPIWAGRYNQIIEQINLEEERKKYGGTTPAVNAKPFGYT